MGSGFSCSHFRWSRPPNSILTKLAVTSENIAGGRPCCKAGGPFCALSAAATEVINDEFFPNQLRSLQASISLLSLSFWGRRESPDEKVLLHSLSQTTRKGGGGGGEFVPAPNVNCAWHQKFPHPRSLGIFPYSLFQDKTISASIFTFFVQKNRRTVRRERWLWLCLSLQTGGGKVGRTCFLPLCDMRT